MSSIAMNIDHRTGRRKAAKHHLAQSQYRGVPKLGPAPDPKPFQPTILKRTTARGMIYLENHGLASFKECRIVVAANKVLHRGMVHSLDGVSSFGI